MANTLELFIARRYLRAKRKQAVVSVITVISIAGVAAGVMALVIALAVNTGMRNTLQRNLLGATAHVLIMEKEPANGIDQWRDLLPKLKALAGVERASPGLYGEMMFSGAQRSAFGVLKGVPTSLSESTTDVLTHLTEGKLSDLNQTGKYPGIILGSRLAQATGMRRNDLITVISPQGEPTPFGMRPAYFQFRVVGLFESGFAELDKGLAFASLETTQKVLSLGDVVNTIELKLSDPNRAPQVAAASEKLIGPRLAATTWMESNPPLRNALNMERKVTVITIGLIELVAALNILITLVMMVMERHKDIAVLMSMGARKEQVQRIFMYQGLLIGCVGTAIGLILGYSLCYLAGHYHWVRLDEDVYGMSSVPFEPQWFDGVWIAAAAIFVSWIATLYPARSAARIAPAEALRYE